MFCCKKLDVCQIQNIGCFLFASIVFLGCGDCVQKANGIILDNQTKTCLADVRITASDMSKDTVTYPLEFSKKNGQFKFSKISGGILQCPNLTLFFYKKGFKQKNLTFDAYSENDTIFLEKIEISNNKSQ